MLPVAEWNTELCV